MKQDFQKVKESVMQFSKAAAKIAKERGELVKDTHALSLKNKGLLEQHKTDIERVNSIQTSTWYKIGRFFRFVE